MGLGELPLGDQHLKMGCLSKDGYEETHEFESHWKGQELTKADI